MQKLLITFLVLYSVHLSAKNCGQFLEKKIVTSSKISCQEAKRVYRLFTQGHTPSDWVCGLSAGACSKGKEGFTFSFN